ncbi:MAG: DUF5010 domain-containing protein [Candidatus Zipacnadales bacterium]
MYSLLVVTILLSALLGCTQDEGWFVEPAAPGPSIGLTPEKLQAVESYRADQPIVGTYLFYWYDVYSGAHLLDHDGTDACTTHPPTWEDYSYHSTRWWREQLTDIAAAGIDFAAPVYWGYPGGYDGWSFQGLPHLVRACDYMRRMGETCPKIALFYDTSTLAHNGENRRIDLSTDDGKAWFYCTIRDFWSFIPPRHWAAIEGRPIILLYASAFAAKQDPALFPYVRKRFQADFGVDPYLIKQTSWEGEADSTCNWGGALGLSMAGCAALGPGYDHSAVPGRQPLIRDREGGAFYARNWETLLRFNPTRRPKLVMVETWNEFHEGTDVAASKEYGRQYIELTRKYADLFHVDERITVVGGPYEEVKSLIADFSQGRENGGIKVPSSGDGITEETEVDGRKCVRSLTSEHPAKYVYFNLDESFAFDLDPQLVTIEVEYYDGGCDGFALEYDSQDPQGSVREGAFKHAGAVRIERTNVWKKASFELTDARFANRCNGSDFRLPVHGPGDLAVAGVKVTKQ